jgi:hypothetical protein
MEFKVMDMCSILGCTRLVFKTQRLSEEAITDSIFLSLKKCCQCGDENRAYNPTELQNLLTHWEHKIRFM